MEIVKWIMRCAAEEKKNSGNLWISTAIFVTTVFGVWRSVDHIRSAGADLVGALCVSCTDKWNIVCCRVWSRRRAHAHTHTFVCVHWNRTLIRNFCRKSKQKKYFRVNSFLIRRAVYAHTRQCYWVKFLFLEIWHMEIFDVIFRIVVYLMSSPSWEIFVRMHRMFVCELWSFVLL